MENNLDERKHFSITGIYSVTFTDRRGLSVRAFQFGSSFTLFAKLADEAQTLSRARPAADEHRLAGRRHVRRFLDQAEDEQGVRTCGPKDTSE